MLIRRETAADREAIADLTTQAFGQPDEARLVELLRHDGDAVLALVAEDEGTLAGHILLSPMRAPFRALGLAPLSVRPSYQGKGIGSALTKAAIAAARAEGYDAIFVLGDAGYYGRFGFSAELAAGFSSPYAGPHFMVLPLQGALPALSGQIDYAPAFSSLG